MSSIPNQAMPQAKAEPETVGPVTVAGGRAKARAAADRDFDTRNPSYAF